MKIKVVSTSFPQDLPRSRGSTGRTKAKPLGWEQYDCVKNANIMVTRVIILLILCEAKKIFWMMEQPVNSLLQEHPMFQKFLAFRGVSVRRMSTSMIWFGGKSRKPTWIYASYLVWIVNFFSVQGFFFFRKTITIKKRTLEHHWRSSRSWSHQWLCKPKFNYCGPWAPNDSPLFGWEWKG